MVTAFGADALSLWCRSMRLRAVIHHSSWHSAAATPEAAPTASWQNLDAAYLDAESAPPLPLRPAGQQAVKETAAAGRSREARASFGEYLLANLVHSPASATSCTGTGAWRPHALMLRAQTDDRR